MLIATTREKIIQGSPALVFIFLNTVLIQWFSKNHATIETSMFGSEFVAMNIFMETIRGIRYNLSMMGVPISGPLYIYGDNMLRIHNTQLPESTLKNKSNSIFYHNVCEYGAMGDSLTGYVGTKKIALNWPPRYCMMGSAGFMCQTIPSK